MPNPTGTCTECGHPAKRLTCGADCAKERKRRRNREIYRKQVANGEVIRGHHHEKTCQLCGEIFMARASARFCSHTCRDLNNLATGQLGRAGKRAQAAHRIDPLESIKIRGACEIQYGTCPECDTAWVGRAGRERRYCSDPCARRARDRARADLARATTCQVAYIPCADCGHTFTTNPAWGKVYCSTRCRKRVETRRLPGRVHKGPWLKHRGAVLARDNFTCWLCGGATSKTYRYDDPWSPTLDHVIPRAAGGTDDLTNLRTAHAICNSLKGAQLMTEAA